MTSPGSTPSSGATAPGFGALRRAMDEALAGFLVAQRERLTALAPASGALLDLVEATVSTGGKRLRPILCWCAYVAGGGTDGPHIRRAAASLELLHTFAILHDDVMDQAVLRRGRPALHRRLADDRRDSGGGEDAATFGISVAVLAGDLALVLSDALFAASGFDPVTIARAEAPLETMRAQAVAGQYLDIVEAGRLAQGPPEEGPPGPEAWGGDAALIGHLKTAGYSVEGPLAVGAALAGASEEVTAALLRYGAALGEAFFRRDELLGLFGEAGQTGKDAESDLRRGKPTVLVADALARGGPAERAVILARWGDPHATPADLAAVRDAVAASGAVAAASGTVDAKIAEAIAALEHGRLAGTPPGVMLAGLAGRLRVGDPA
jgi:geranylgeranyl diphosphate synthase type I